MPQHHIYLSGEIHTDWRETIAKGAHHADLDVEFMSAVTDHETSDKAGVRIFGDEDDRFWEDHKGARLNSIRTRTLIQRADLVVVRFGDKYRQWNAAFEAGFAAALGKPIITLHDEGLNHALKEVNAAASATARTPEQVVQALIYILRGTV